MTRTDRIENAKARAAAFHLAAKIYRGFATGLATIDTHTAQKLAKLGTINGRAAARIYNKIEMGTI